MIEEHEVRQIAGRAGRGIINGEVWAITKNDQKYLKKCL